MPRLPSSSLGRAISKQTNRAPLAGKILRVNGGVASVRLPDSSVVDVPIPAGVGYGQGARVMVQWNAKEQPIIVSGRAGEMAGAARVVKLSIPQVDDFAPDLPDGLVASDFYGAMMLNHFMNGTPLPAVSTLYVALMSRINSKNDYAEITSASVSNIKRAGKARNTTEFPLATSGREISNAIAVGAGTAGALDSFLTSGTGFASAFDAEGWGVFDAATGGNFWFGAKFDAVNGIVKRSVAAGNSFSIPVGGLRARFSAGGLTDFEARNYLNVTFNNMVFARTRYRVGLLTSSQGAEPSMAAFTNYKQAKIPRDLATFPLATNKTIACALAIGNGTSATDNSFLSGFDVARLTQSFPIYGIGLYEGDTGPLCWTIPNTAAIVKNSDAAPRIPEGRLFLKLS